MLHKCTGACALLLLVTTVYVTVTLKSGLQKGITLVAFRTLAIGSAVLATLRKRFVGQ